MVVKLGTRVLTHDDGRLALAETLYDALGRPMETTSPLNYRIQYHHDANGQPVDCTCNRVLRENSTPQFDLVQAGPGLVRSRLARPMRGTSSRTHAN